MNRLSSGDALTQYAIIVSLIALFLIPSFMNLSKTIKTNFEQYNTSINDINKEIDKNIVQKEEMILKGTVQPGQLEGTIEEPVAECIESICSIDFGEYVFNNIPENFKEFVETSGFSGGTQILADLLDDIAEESITLTDSNKTNLIIQLAQQGHILADYEEQLELNTTNLINDPTLNIKNTFITPSKKITEGQYRINFDKTLTDINELFKEPLTPEEEQLLKIINLLGIEITNLADNMGEMASNIKGNNFTQEELEAILFPKASTLTDLDSAILCINGSGKDVNNICNP